MEKIYSYMLNAVQVWEGITCIDRRVDFLPPKVRVDTENLLEVGHDQFCLGRLETKWHNDKWRKILVPYHTEIVLFHKSILKSIEREFCGDITYTALKVIINQVILHEYLHYLEWSRLYHNCHSDDDPRPYNDAFRDYQLAFDQGTSINPLRNQQIETFYFEKENQANTIRYMKSINSLSEYIHPVADDPSFMKLFPKWNGPYVDMVAKKLPEYKDLIAMIRWYEIEYILDFETEKYTNNELDALAGELHSIRKYIRKRAIDTDSRIEDIKFEVDGGVFV